MFLVPLVLLVVLAGLVGVLHSAHTILPMAVAGERAEILRPLLAAAVAVAGMVVPVEQGLLLSVLVDYLEHQTSRVLWADKVHRGLSRSSRPITLNMVAAAVEGIQTSLQTLSAGVPSMEGAVEVAVVGIT